MNYSLKRKDINIAFFSIKNRFIDKCIIDKENTELLPLPLKRLVKAGYKEEFVEIETDDYYLLNEEGCTLVDNWLSEREIPVNRFNYDMYIKKGSNPRKWLLENNGYSFNDCYWFESENEDLQWDCIKERFASLDFFYTVKDNNRIYKGQNSTLGGQLEKFWYKTHDDVMLCKKIDMQYDILAAREIIASLVYEKQQYGNFCKYNFVYNKNGDIIGCTCKAFTNENVELISSYDLLEEYNMTQTDDVWERIIELAANYGLDKKQTSDYLDMQTLVDYLITNRDRHERNIGFLRDANTLKLFHPAPIFDNGSSKSKEGEYPESLTNTTVNGLYTTELEHLQHVKNFDLLDLSKIPSRNEIEAIFNKCRGLTPIRKNFLLDMYEEKKDFLIHLQEQYRLGTDMCAYIEKCKECTKEVSEDIFDNLFNM